MFFHFLKEAYMISVGNTCSLAVTTRSSQGYICRCGEDQVLVSAGASAPELKPGQTVNLFIYGYQDPFYLGSLRQPCVRPGEFAVLKVAAKTAQGAFLDWGLEKDLFLPVKEQTAEIRVNDQVPVYVLKDSRSRQLMATMKINRYFASAATEFKTGQKVEAVVYRTGDLGAFCMVDRIFQGLIYQSDLFEDLALGQVLTVYVTKVREDGKLDLSLRQSGKAQNVNDQQVILTVLKENRGFLPCHDKTDPDTIRKMLNMSKKGFKRAVGSLYKAKKIKIENNGIRLA